jgi:hypothetical protein
VYIYIYIYMYMYIYVSVFILIYVCIVPTLKASIHEDYKKWAEPVVKYGVQSFAISLAWFLQRIVSAFHAALRGSKVSLKNGYRIMISILCIACQD